MGTRVFITGMGAVSPLGLDVASTWAGMLRGVSVTDTIQAFDPTGLETRFAVEVKGFNPLNYLDKKETRRMDRFAHFAVVACKEAIAQARLDMNTVDPYRVAVLIGSGVGGIITLSQQFQVLKEKGARWVSPFLMPMMLADMASAQISMMTGALGPNFCLVSSCSSSADALGQAWEMLRRGEIDIALAGGAEAPICPIAIAGFDSLRALSRNNDDPVHASRPFDAHRDGFVMGEGGAILVLETEESMRKRGVEPLAELLSYAATSDAHHVTEPCLDGRSAAHAMRLAVQRAGLQPEDVDYINAHGTSTPLNDKIETLAIKQAFGEEAYRIPISSTKSMTGHLLGAGGALEAVACVMAVKEGVIPPTINLQEPDPACDLDYTPYIAKRGQVRTALSNSFGFGGHNSVLAFGAVNHR